ncbi:sugar phosphate isomerase/epimerase family protein [Halorubrum aethiopicum]|uniref:sugar phosphate isomerase/epimerase family protein n=1 Tax=Halorubrum aethiopicum TaxID=1758255 RepID=UPI00082B32BC|nr:sugar phosphate isomerase/epimerase [Halorubrum aethiopicum]
MVHTAINLYTVRDSSDGTLDLLTRTSDAGYDGVELAYEFVDEDPTAIRSCIDRLGLDCPAVHIELDPLTNRTEAVIDWCSTVGVETVVLPYLDVTNFDSAEAVTETATFLESVAAPFRDEGFDFCYHNHDHELRWLSEDNETALHLLMAELEMVDLELDIGWVQAAGRDPIAFLNRHANRIDLIHAKDVVAETRTPIEAGMGDVDFEDIEAAVRDAGCSWAIYEHDSPDDPLGSLSHGAKFLSEWQMR